MTAPLDFSTITAPPKPTTFDSAKEEENNWDIYDELDKKHGGQFREIIFYIASFGMIFFSTLFFVLVTIWFTNMILPEKCRWLTQHDMQGIERILFTSALVSVTGKYFSKFKLLEKK